MYELQIEKGVEKDIKDLKKSSGEEFNRIISHINDTIFTMHNKHNILCPILNFLLYILDSLNYLCYIILNMGNCVL